MKKYTLPVFFIFAIFALPTANLATETPTEESKKSAHKNIFLMPIAITAIFFGIGSIALSQKNKPEKVPTSLRPPQEDSILMPLDQAFLQEPRPRDTLIIHNNLLFGTMGNQLPVIYEDDSE